MTAGGIVDIMEKTLLVYYTLEGNTGYVADVLGKYDGVDVEQLKPRKEPPKDGFGKFLIGGKSALFQSDPDLQPVQANVEEYPNIILAFPVWAGTYPPAIGAFLKQYPLTGKRVSIIACSAGGNADKAFRKIKDKTSGSTIAGTLSLVNPLQHQEETRKKIAEAFA